MGIIHLVRTQNVSRSEHFLPPDTHTYVCVSGAKKCEFFEIFCIRTKWMIPCLYINNSNRLCLQGKSFFDNYRCSLFLLLFSYLKFSLGFNFTNDKYSIFHADLISSMTNFRKFYVEFISRSQSIKQHKMSSGMFYHKP